MKKNQGFWVLIGLFFSFATPLWASVYEEYRLNRPMDMRMAYDNSRQLHFIETLPRDTVVIVKRDHQRFRGWLEVTEIRAGSFAIERDRRLQRAQDEMRFASHRDRFYVDDNITRSATYLGRVRQSNHRPPHIPRPVEPRPYYGSSPSFNAYHVCYEQPYQRWETTNQQQARQGRNNALIGIVGVIGGQIIGGDAGNVISVGSALLTGYGLVQMSSAQSPVTYYNTQCDQYYTRDTRVRHHRLEGRSCTTHRYYSRDWNREVEYFRTTCSGSTYYSFERNRNIWY